jgi:hypothetical protein
MTRPWIPPTESERDHCKPINTEGEQNEQAIILENRIGRFYFGACID